MAVRLTVLFIMNLKHGRRGVIACVSIATMWETFGSLKICTVRALMRCILSIVEIEERGRAMIMLQDIVSSSVFG